MVIIDHIDGPNRRIYLHADTVGNEVHPMDVYKEMRTLRRTDETLRKYDLFMSGEGNVKKKPDGSKRTERYVILLSGTLIVPYDTTHELTITGTVITDTGLEGPECFDRTPLTATSVVDINYVPPQVEVITIATGSGLTEAQDTKLFENLTEDDFLALK